MFSSTVAQMAQCDEAATKEIQPQRTRKIAENLKR